jgi:transcriptional regulator with XRE-family HTH domain
VFLCSQDNNQKEERIMQTIGERIKFIRLQENVTMAKMASKLGTYHADLLMIENGTKEPSVELIIKIHRLFPRYSIYLILYGVEEDENMNVLTGKDASSLVKQIEKYLNQLNIMAELEEANIFGFDINMENTMMSVRELYRHCGIMALLPFPSLAIRYIIWMRMYKELFRL